MQLFIRKIASIKIHPDAKLLSEQPTAPGLFAHTLSNSEIRKIETFEANGMRDETHIRLTGKLCRTITTTIHEIAQVFEMDRRKTINRSDGNMLSYIQEHSYSRIPALSETQTLPL